MKAKKGCIILLVCLLISSCASIHSVQESVQKNVVQSYREEMKDFKKDFFKVRLAPPEVLLYEKTYGLASLALAPILRPVNEQVIRPFVLRPIDRYFIQPFVYRTISWVGHQFGLGKKPRRMLTIPEFTDEQIHLCLWDGHLAVSKPSIPRAPQKLRVIITHTVQKGEWLWKIAEKYYGHGKYYKLIASANNIKYPDVIEIDQKLVIPQQTTGLKKWIKVGGNPYKGTWQEAINSFDIPEKIKTQIRENVESGKFQWLPYGLESGQRLNQVIFGQGKIWTNVLCAWPKGKAYAAKDYGVGNYHVIKVSWCNNWAWWIDKKVLPRPKAPTGVRIEEEKEKKAVLLSGKLIKEGGWFWDFKHWELSTGVFKERCTDDTEVHGGWSVLSYYPLVYQDEVNRRHQFGLAVENINWRGDSGDRFHFSGHKKFMIGPSYKLNTLKSETYFRILYGQRKDSGFKHSESSSDYYDGRDKYNMEQRTNIISAYLSHERRNDERDWFPKIRFYSLINLDFGHQKKAWWRGYDEEAERVSRKRVEAITDDKDTYGAGFWLDIYKYQEGLIVPQIGFEVKYHAEGYKLGLRPGFGLSFLEDSLFFGLNYTFWNKHFADAWGIEAYVDLYNLYRYYFGQKEVMKLKGSIVKGKGVKDTKL